MACSIEEQKQLVEAAKAEYKRLADLQKQGYDVDEDNGILDIESAMKDMHAIIQRRPDKLDAFKGTDKPELLANMLKANGDNGTLAMSFNGSNDSKSATPSRLTEDNGMYVLSTDKGTYKFKPGKIQSEPVNGKYVVVPAMVLTKQSIQGNVLGSIKVTAGFALSDNANKAMENKRARSKELGNKVAKLNAKEKAIYSELTSNTKQVNPEYQNYMLNWLKSKTNASISYNKEILGLSNLLSSKLNIIAGTYAKATNHIQILDNVTRADVEKDIRSQLYVNYLESQGKSVEEFNEEIIDVFNTPEANKLINEATANTLKVIEKTKDGHTLVHELIHANTQIFMEQNKEHPATKRIQELYQIALDNQKSIDSAITDTDLIGGYWSNNVDEFVAEGLSNPYVMEALMNVPVEGKSRLSVFKELIKSIVEMLGFKGTDKDNVYELLMDSLMNIVEEQGNPDVSKKMDSDKMQELMGSDSNARIGSVDTDTAVAGFDVDLGQALVDVWIDLYKADIDAGIIAEDKINLFNAYANPEQFEKDKPELSEFDKLQAEMLKTYQTTMAELGTGDVAVDMFESEVDPTGGTFNKKTQEIKVRLNRMSRLASGSEVFMHEVNHKMSSHVFAKDIGLKNLVKELRDSVIDSGVDYTVFLEGIADPTKAEIAMAKMKFEYVFDRTANPEEFYAYATTNERVYNAVKDVEITTPLFKPLQMEKGTRQPFKIAWNKIINSVNAVWRMMTGRGVKGGELIADMIKTIAAVDVEMAQKKATEEQVDESISGLASAKMAKLDEKVKPVIDKVAEWVENLQGSKTKSIGKQIAKIPLLNELMATGISQYLWRTVTQDTTGKDVAEMYMVFRHSKQVVEKHTADIRNGVKMVADEMYKDVEETTKEAVKKIVLEGDLAQYNATEIKDMLEDESVIDAKIAKLESELKKPSKELTAQIDGLAEYLVSGESTSVNQQLNANNIAFGAYNNEPKQKFATESIKTIDQLVTLKALKKTDKKEKFRLKQLLETAEGMDTLDKTINMYRSYIDNMRADATIDGYDPIPKGYTRPADGLLRYELIPENEIKAQESVLMKLVNSKPHVTVGGVRYYLMTGRTKSVGFTEGAIGLISHTTEGLSISGLLTRENDMKGKKGLSATALKSRTNRIIKEIASGEGEGFQLGDAKTLVPVYNHKEEIVDYRVQLSKQEKEMHLPDRETGLEDVLSNTFSRSIKTSLTATENRRVVDTIIENSGRGVLENPDDYVIIEEYTEEDAFNGVKRERRHDRWDYLPEHTKSYIFSKTRNKGIAIHKDFVELMTGEKDITIGNFAAFGWEMRQHPVARARLMAIEAYVAEIISYVKQAMIVLNGDILVGNQVSNAMVAANHGINPIKYTKKFKQRWQELNDYNEKVQILAELEVKQMAGEKVDGKIRQLKLQLEGNVWDELVKDGQYTALVEDINIEKKMDGQIAQLIQKGIDKSNFKGILEGARSALYIDKTSSLYAGMLKTVHYGDAITRQIIKEELEERAIKRDGVLKQDTKREILNYLDQLLVNYGYIPNRWWGYADKVLGLLFMKYYLNQPKAIMSMSRNNPTKVALMQGAQYATGVDISDPINTYTNSGLDGIGYRWMLADVPGDFAMPNIFDLVPGLNSALVMR